MPQSMLADVIAVNARKTGGIDAGVFAGSFTFFYKMAQSVAILLTGPMLDLIGFNAEKEVQSRFTLLALGYCMSIGMIAVLSMSLYNYSCYGLTQDELGITNEE